MSLLPLGILSSSGAGAAGAFELISTQVLTGTAASVTFGSIPSTFKHLQLRITTRGGNTATSQDDVLIQFNNDTGNNYSFHTLQANGSSVTSVNVGTYTFGYIGLGPSSTNTANAYSGAIVDILDYANTNKNKTTRALFGYKGSDSWLGLVSSGWYSTSAITSLKLTAGFSFLTGSRFSLYGVKGS